MVLLIDNYDSFSFNLYQLIGSMSAKVKVVRSDELTVPEVLALQPSHIVLSPGPGRPSEAGIYETLISEIKGNIPLLGVCLGHQAIAEAYGGTIGYAKEILHGKASEVTQLTKSVLFEDIPTTFQVARYHSLAVIGDTLPNDLVITAETADGEIMALEHRQYPIFGVQFHPESILTPCGAQLIENFLAL
ncbi:anthranilate synthase component II [Veillonella intestinalis]|uniref:anthranilate synthase component II n=1 Tax=Veillonella intestinalis TaxID=2941341 RepID=UPI00203BB8C0|nr:aminodeoxychorismate/anthranilate synthase component II [Veillonella intestinalis]